jgi:2-polyprenyl-3-methyl-5-hydroxy-6-metoxy-1,4-benzoquinol methylase
MENRKIGVMKKNWTGERWETFVHNETALEHLHRYAVACELSANKTVLDMACGEGYGSRLLSVNARAVTGVDIDAATIQLANEKYKAPHLRFITSDARATSLPSGSFELVVSFETLEHLEEQDQFLVEIKRILTPGGRLIISTPDTDQYSVKSGFSNPFHKKELNRKQFETLLHSYFKNVQILTQQTCHSSLISQPGQTRFDIYSGNQDQLGKNLEAKGLYLIAIASDEELPEVNNSLFNARSILQSALDAQEKMVRQTLTYRVGHRLLSPFKWIKTLLK